MATHPAGIPRHRFVLRTSAAEGTTVVTCLGRLTSDSSEAFKTEVKSLIPNAKRIVLDFGELNYLDSSGLGAVVAVYVSAKTAGCELQLVNLGGRVKELLGMTHVLSIFEKCGEYMIKMP